MIDDDYDLFGERESPEVVELSPFPERQLAQLLSLTTTDVGEAIGRK